MKKIYLGLLISLLSNVMYAQDVSFEWAKSIGGTEDVVYSDFGYSITQDNLGNVYVTGQFSGSVDFDPGENVFELTSTSVGEGNIFILKLDSGGNFVWVKSIDGIGDGLGTSIITDDFDNIYLTGGYTKTLDFDPGQGIFELTSTADGGEGDIFILKLDSDGNFVWAKSVGGLNYDFGYSIKQDDSNNIYLIGYFSEVVDFDPGDNIFELTSKELEDAFILKLDSDGNFVWVKSLGGIEYDFNSSIITDNSNNIYLTGEFNGSVDFDPGDNIFELTSKELEDAFILKLDSDGNFVWAKSLGGLGDVEIYHGTSITTDNSNNIYVTGEFDGLVDFDSSDNVFELSSNGENTDAFILKLDSDGNFVWAKSFGGTGYDGRVSITTDNSNNTYITGYYEGTVDFDPGNNVFELSSNGENTDAFILKLDSDGNFVWAKSFGGIGEEYFASIIADDSDNIYITGGFSETVDFDPSPSIFDLTSNGYYDIFILKLKNLTANVEKTDDVNQVSIYPNPTNGEVNLHLGSLENVSIKIFSADNKLVYSEENIINKAHQIKLNTEPGVYFVEISSQSGKLGYKLIKN